jgi:hypothetical protein
MREFFKIRTQEEFGEACMELFRYQVEQCDLYKEYVGLLGIEVKSVHTPEEIPMLPIKLFKSRQIVTSAHKVQKIQNREFTSGGTDSEHLSNVLDAVGKAEMLLNEEFDAIFTSSATTGMRPSKHYVRDISLYERSFIEGFKLFYGNPEEYAILSLLPSYLERKGSSLVYMAEKLMSMASEGGFYLYDHDKLYKKLCDLKSKGGKTILLGVTFALLDFVEKYRMEFPDLIILETGGMKGRGKEIPRDELHKILKQGFGVERIHSEYGMSELLSQAYSNGNGLFSTPPWMQIQISDLYDSSKRLSFTQNDTTIGKEPFKGSSNECRPGLTATAQGRINIIDLANINSCAFIETEDIGRKYPDNTFTVDGRLKNSELRGCNMLLG